MIDDPFTRTAINNATGKIKGKIRKVVIELNEAELYITEERSNPSIPDALHRIRRARAQLLAICESTEE